MFEGGILKRPIASDTEVQHFFDSEYRDRGMLKWQGYFLSDHTSALKKEAKKKPPKMLEQQPGEIIAELLMSAWQTKKPVVVQLKEVDQSRVPVQFIGTVQGYQADRIGINTGEEIKYAELEEIKNVQIDE